MIELLGFPALCFALDWWQNSKRSARRVTKRSAFFQNIGDKVRNFRENNAGLLYIILKKKILLMMIEKAYSKAIRA